MSENNERYGSINIGERGDIIHGLLGRAVKLEDATVDDINEHVRRCHHCQRSIRATVERAQAESKG